MDDERYGYVVGMVLGRLAMGMRGGRLGGILRGSSVVGEFVGGIPWRSGGGGTSRWSFCRDGPLA
jgi:hypothetical protein